jgi:hypothetical protein
MPLAERQKCLRAYRVAQPGKHAAQADGMTRLGQFRLPVPSTTTEAPLTNEEQHMTSLVMLLLTTAVPSADPDPVSQPQPASHRRFSHLRPLFGRHSQRPQQQPGSVWVGPPGGVVQPGCACGVQPMPVAVSGAPSAAGPITSPFMLQGPQQQPGSVWIGPPGGAVQAVPTAAGPLTSPVMSQGPQQQPGGGTPSATEPNPVMSRPEVTTPPVTPQMRQMPVGPARPF